MQNILAEMKKSEKILIGIRKDIHQHPELGFQEHRTSQIISELLTAWGIEVRRGIAGTGVIGTLKGSREGRRSIGLRADIDGLSINESSASAHKSIYCGRMHACGHDGHTAMLLGAAKFLAGQREFAGTVHFIFQPAEEGLGGAREMIRAGLFELANCDAIYGMHNWPELEEGKFAIRSGPFFASSDTWTVTFFGVGGHGGIGAHNCVDPFLSAAQFILGAHTVIGRNVAANDTAVLSIGHIAGGDFNTPNAIPSTIVLRGTARSFLASTRSLIEHRLGELASAHAAAVGCTFKYDYQRRYPPLVNHFDQVEVAAAAAAELVGDANVDRRSPMTTAGEDFAFMLEKKPGAYILIGAGPNQPSLHSPNYDFNDRIISLGASYWISVVDKELGSGR